jgi:N-acetylglucosaminyl-diphospho-decaprenol L-rhamnosyltransferase
MREYIQTSSVPEKYNAYSQALLMDISIIIVSYNTVRLVTDCLTSLQKTDDLQKEVFVVDNCSTDGSAEVIKANFPAVTLIVNQKNLGFGTASNQALPYCNGRYLVFLNPDTTVAVETLKTAVSYMEANPYIGLAGAKILNPDGSMQPSVSYKYPGEKFAAKETKGLAGEIACVMGAFMIARKTLINELRGFDEDFFLYGEDQDLCWRIRQRGYSIGYIKDAQVLHWGGQSEIHTPCCRLFAKKLRAEYLFYQKHYSPETISRIKQEARLKARFRLATLKLLSLVTGNSESRQNKIDCYKIALYKAKLGE